MNKDHTLHVGGGGGGGALRFWLLPEAAAKTTEPLEARRQQLQKQAVQIYCFLFKYRCMKEVA